MPKTRGGGRKKGKKPQNGIRVKLWVLFKKKKKALTNIFASITILK